MKKIISFILVLSVCLSLLIGTTQAVGTPELAISSGTVKAGEDVLLKVTIKDNPGIAATMVYVYYDTNTFTVDPDDDISAAGAFANSGGMIGNSIAIAKQNGRYEGKSGKDGVLALWYNGSGVNTTNDGAVFTVRLHTAATAANGDYTIELDVADASTVNEAGDELMPRSVNGVVTVTGGVGEKAPDPVENEDPDEIEKDDDDEREQTPEEVPEFTDVAGNWAESYIKQSAERGLVEGYQGLYRPNDTMTRAEFVTILWRAMGEPAPAKTASFTDLTQDWYLKPVAWAEENAVVNGMGDGLFAPNGTVTREQMVTIFHRLAGTPTGMELMLTSVYDSQYPDSTDVGAWAKAALYWSVYNGIYCGVNSEEIGTRLNPGIPATRAQIAVMIVRYLDMTE